MKQKNQKERLINLITDEWQSAKELSVKTGLNSYQVGAVCRRYIKQGLVECRLARTKIFGGYKKIKEYRRTF